MSVRGWRIVAIAIIVIRVGLRLLLAARLLLPRLVLLRQRRNVAGGRGALEVRVTVPEALIDQEAEGRGGARPGRVLFQVPFGFRDAAEILCLATRGTREDKPCNAKRGQDFPSDSMKHLNPPRQFTL